ncbi:MAG: uracil-xanthine permease family protein [Opitutales bacterium]
MGLALLLLPARSMTGPETPQILFPHNARMPPLQALMAGFLQVAAMFVGCITPALIFCAAVDVPDGAQGYLLSMALLTAGLGTFLQARRLGPIGSGLLSVNGTSFAYVTLVVTAGQQGGIALACGMALAAVPVQFVLAFFLPFLSRVISPLVAGTVVMIIGLSLIPAVAGRYLAWDLGEGFTWHTNVLLAGVVLGVLVVAQLSRNPYIRTGGPLLALLAGYVIAGVLGLIQWGAPPTSDRWIMLPQWMPYGLAFDWTLLLPFAIVYLISSLEAIGDLSATAHLSGMQTGTPAFWKRLRGGIFSDAITSTLAALVNIFPTATFSQNNGVIQMTGVGARQVGYYVAGILVLCALLPQTSYLFGLIPRPVLGAVMLMLFGLVFTAGLRMVLSTPLGTRELTVLALSLGAAFSIPSQPEFIAQLPAWMGSVLESSVATGGLVVVVLNLLLLTPWRHAATQDKIVVPGGEPSQGPMVARGTEIGLER